MIVIVMLFKCDTQTVCAVGMRIHAFVTENETVSHLRLLCHLTEASRF